MKEDGWRIIHDPDPQELRGVLKYELLKIVLPGQKWQAPQSGLGYVEIHWMEGVSGPLWKCEVRGPALLRGLIKGHRGDPLPDCLAMRVCAMAVHDYYRQIIDDSTWKWPR